MLLLQSKHTIIKRIRISEKKFSLLVKCFALDLNARQSAKLLSCNRNTTNRFFTLLRFLIITQALAEQARERITNGVEIDESYFGPRRQRGNRGRGATKNRRVRTPQAEWQSVCANHS